MRLGQGLPVAQLTIEWETLISEVTDKGCKEDRRSGSPWAWGRWLEVCTNLTSIGQGLLLRRPERETSSPRKGHWCAPSLLLGRSWLGELLMHSWLCPGWPRQSPILMTSFNCRSFPSTEKWLKILKALLPLRKSNLPDVFYLSPDNTLWLRPASPIISSEKEGRLYENCHWCFQRWEKKISIGSQQAWWYLMKNPVGHVRPLWE